jgi:hypothetical protein
MEATRSTPYAASIKPIQRRKDGRGAWLALLGQYAGNDKWETEIKIQEAVLHTRMSFYVLQHNGEVVTKRTIRKLTPQEQEDKTVS